MAYSKEILKIRALKRAAVEAEPEEKYMKEAIKLAKKALKLGEVPIGCVIVRDGEIIGGGYNRRNVDKVVLAHAEITAIKKACKKLGDFRLEDCVMYVTLEPCPMCAGAIVQARIPRLFYGCTNDKAGSAGTIINVLDVKGFNHKTKTTGSILENECKEVLQEFFKGLRLKRVQGNEKI